MTAAGWPWEYMVRARLAQQSRMHDERLRFDVWRTVHDHGLEVAGIAEMYEAITGRPWVRELLPEDEVHDGDPVIEREGQAALQEVAAELARILRIEAGDDDVPGLEWALGVVQKRLPDSPKRVRV